MFEPIRIWYCFVATAAVVVNAILNPAVFSQPSITAIDNLPGGSELNPNAISADGSSVTGATYYDDNFVLTAFHWTKSGGTQDIGNPYVAGGESTGRGISGDGKVIAGFSYETSSKGYRWTAGGGFEDLGSLIGFDNIYALGISNDGSVIVGNNLGPVNGIKWLAFRWSELDGMQSLGTLSGGDFSTARSVSSDGAVIVGDSGTSSGGRRAFRWTSIGGMQDLGSIESGFDNSGAIGISGDGKVIVGSGGSSIGLQAFRWTEAGGMQALGLTDGNTYSEFYCANHDGSAIVGESGTDSGSSAVYWTPATGMVDLNTYLPSLGVELTGWYLDEARAISFDGTAITGGGTYNGELRGWVVSGLPSVPVGVLGDANGDGSFDFGDIEAFFLAVTDLPAYVAQYPDVAVLLLDMNQDGNTDFGDIEAFFNALTG